VEVQERATQILPTGPNSHCIVLDAANRYAYSAVPGANHVMQMIFDAEPGMLVANTPPTIVARKEAGPRHVAFRPKGRIRDLLKQTYPMVSMLRIEAGAGTPTESQTSATLPAHFLGAANAADIHVTPDGRFLDASER
jgi:6-phosphogluconolactonase